MPRRWLLLLALSAACDAYRIRNLWTKIKGTGVAFSQISSSDGSFDSGAKFSVDGEHSEDQKIHPVLGLNPTDIDIRERPIHLTAAALRERGNLTNFIEMFRSSAPYIRMHRGTVMVIHIPGECFQTGVFTALMDEIALISMLGSKIVLVIGCAPQIEAALRAKQIRFEMTTTSSGVIGITTSEILSVVKECAGWIRFEVESALTKGRTGSTHVNVSGGNLYAAQPVGVRDGIDYGFTGEVRRIDATRILERLDAGDVVYLTCLGFSHSGQVFNVSTEDLAHICAVTLQARKLMYLMRGEDCLWDTKASLPLLSLRLREANMFVKYMENQSSIMELNEKEKSMLQLVGNCVKALKHGVTRAHIVPPVEGGLIEELYTREGAGILISRDIYEGISVAEPKHLPSISTIISKVAEENDWIPPTLESQLPSWIVFTKDEKVVGCACLNIAQGEGENDVESCTSAEVSHLFVLQPYRSQGIGRALLGFLERMALSNNIHRIFALTATGGQWLVERGFISAAPNTPVPIGITLKKAASKRGRIIYVKQLSGTRGIDADELLWDIDSKLRQNVKI